MGTFGEIFGGSKEAAEFKVDQPEAAAEQPITPENKQEILPTASEFTSETGKMVASVERVEEIPAEKSKLEELLNTLESTPETLPQQN